MSVIEIIHEALADFSAMTPTLQAVIAFDGSWHRNGGLIAEGSVQLVINAVVVGEVQIVGDEDEVNPYSATFTGIANPGPGVTLVTALLVLVSPSSRITADNVVITITCEGVFVNPLIAPAPSLPRAGDSETGQDIACITDVGTSLSLARGPRNVGNALARRLITPRGGLFYDPNYGLDIRNYLNAGFTPQALAQGQSDVASEVSKDPRVEDPIVTVVSDLATASMQITITCELAEGPHEFVFGVSLLTVELLKQQALA
jgi:hypothetical protein